MIPVSLTIEGLYSYKERQTIAFDNLVASQLFGIFGEVGSGKSAILEAMMLAIYGKSDRVSGGGKNYNIMNLQATFLQVDFTCFSGPQGDQLYRFLFECKRNSKNHRDVKFSRKMIYKMEECGEWQPVEGETPEQIIGMSAEHFTKTIIIPQGQFRDFIGLTPSERTKMLQELFQLDRFDLSDKVGSLQKQNDQAVHLLQGELTALEHFTEENLQILAEEGKKLEAALPGHLQQLAEAEKTLQEAVALSSLAQEQQTLQKKLAQLIAKQPEIEQKTTQLQKYLVAEQHFAERLVQWNKQELEVNRTDQELQSLAVALSKHRETQAQTVTTFEITEKDYLNREENRMKCRELEELIVLKQVSDQLAQLLPSREKTQQQLAQLQTRLEGLRAERKHLDDAIPGYRATVAKTGRLTQLQAWEKQRVHLASQCGELTSKLNDLEKEKEGHLQTMAAIAREAGQETKTLGTGQLRETLAQLAQEKASLQVRMENHQALAQLQEGEPCPLCGSVHHPAKATGEDEEVLIQKMAQIGQIMQQTTQWMQQVESCQSALGKVEGIHAILAGQLQQLEQSLQIHQQAWHWQEEDQQALLSLENTLETIGQTHVLLEEAEKKRDQFSQQETTLLEKISSQQQNQHALNAQIAQLEATQTEKRGLIRLLNVEALMQKDSQTLKENLAKGLKRIEQTELDFLALKDQLAQLKLKEQEMVTRQELLREQHRKLLEEKEKSGEQLQTLLEIHQFQGLATVKNLLKEKPDVTAWQKAIETHQDLVKETSRLLAEVSRKMEGKIYDLQAHKQAEQVYKDRVQEKDTLQQQMAVNHNQQVHHREQLLHKQTRQALLNQLTDRQAALKVLANLFRGRGFVEFVSAIYLQNLVQAANERFLRLTNHALSLGLNEQLEFIVTDYLNSGHTRLLKTLSGGQTFQAALCMALSLAENIRHVNQSGRSFFFLDEGFGTLDKKSLATVFNTLRALQKENRIVGIISHIEELQQEIPVALLVENHPEKGSQLRYSWETQ